MKLNGLEEYFETNEDGEIVDFKQFDRSHNGHTKKKTPLLYALAYNKEKDLNLNTEQWNYLIKNSDLKELTQFKQSPLMLAFAYIDILPLKEGVLRILWIKIKFLNLI